jgi:hypothetical protein
MELARLPRLQDRFFRCSNCYRIEAIPFSLDPKKTDAVGWLFSEPRRRQ